jgi:pimeloyl-ACP methyl ester carboxylesterase
MTAVGRRRRRILLIIYLSLLVTSAIVRRSISQPILADGMRAVSLPQVTQNRATAGRIKLAFVDTDPDSTSMPVILVHGSPGSSHIFGELTAMLSGQFRVIVPDLPGFGASTHDLPDYSFRAHARYIVELLDALHISKAQFVGFSMGGGAVLSIADIAPERVASIVMLSAIGVQEQELLGNYYANHLLHGLQLGGLWLLREGVPHFGVLDDVELNVEYARNFYDSDQRPLRSVLRNFRGPMLIIHGARDPLVPIAAANEHHSLVPQSELRLLDDNHFMVFQRPFVLIQPLQEFLQRTMQTTHILN